MFQLYNRILNEYFVAIWSSSVIFIYLILFGIKMQKLSHMFHPLHPNLSILNLPFCDNFMIIFVWSLFDEFLFKKYLNIVFASCLLVSEEESVEEEPIENQGQVIGWKIMVDLDYQALIGWLLYFDLNFAWSLNEWFWLVYMDRNYD